MLRGREAAYADCIEANRDITFVYECRRAG